LAPGIGVSSRKAVTRAGLDQKLEKVISMKALSKLLVVSVTLAVVLLPIATLSGDLAEPLKKVVNPPQETIHYSGQTLKFTTSVPLKVTLMDMGNGKILLKFRSEGVLPGGNAPSSNEVIVDWEDWNNKIYNGAAPDDPWSVYLLTESGFTEK
jgi:hypothetical protein